MNKITKVTLVWTLYTPLVYQEMAPSLSIAYLAKALEQYGIPAVCIDCNLLVYGKWGIEKVTRDNMDDLLMFLVKETEATNPDVLGVGYWTEGISFVKEFVRVIKERNPDLKIIIGGPSATFLPRETLNFIPETDFIVRGEGEGTLVELVMKLSKNESINSVRGISFRGSKGQVIINPDRPLLKNLDRLPLIDYENFTYIGKHRGFSVLTSRGCPFGCRYCSATDFSGIYRSHSPDYVLKQVRHLIKLYKISYVSLSDENVVLNPLNAMKLFGLFAEAKLDCDLPMGARIDYLTKEVVDLLVRARVTWITAGIESIIPKTLIYYGRTRDVNGYLKKIKRGIKLIEKAKISAAFNFVLGAPTETEEDMRESLNFMGELNKKNYMIYASWLRLIPGSHFWQEHQAGKREIFYMGRSNKFPFDDNYINTEWICPANYAFKHDFYSNEEYLRLRSKFLLAVGKFQKDPTKMFNNK